MSDEDLLPKNFTKERSLWTIFVQARRIPANKFNAFSTALVFGASIATVWLSSRSSADTTQIVRDGAVLGFNTSLVVLGFLVAGFTIFATISNPNMLIRMGGTRHPDSGLSWLKHTFFLLIRVFIYYISFLVFCFIIIFFGSQGGLLSTLLRFTPNSDYVKFCIVNIAFVILVSWQYFLLVQLKSFIFNIYHSVVASLRWKAEGYDEKQESSENANKRDGAT